MLSISLFYRISYILICSFVCVAIANLYCWYKFNIHVEFINLLNPCNLTICGLNVRDKVQIDLIQINIFKKRFIFTGVTLKDVALKNKDKEAKGKDGKDIIAADTTNTTRPTSEISQLPAWLVPYLPKILRYLNDFIFLINDINIPLDSVSKANCGKSHCLYSSIISGIISPLYKRQRTELPSQNSNSVLGGKMLKMQLLRVFFNWQKVLRGGLTTSHDGKVLIDILGRNLFLDQDLLLNDFIFSTSSLLNLDNSDIFKNFIIELKLGNVELPLSLILKNNSNALNINENLTTDGHGKFSQESYHNLKKNPLLAPNGIHEFFTEEEIINGVQNFKLKLIEFSKSLRLIDQVRFTMDKFIIKDILITKIKDLSNLNNFLTYQIMASDINLNIRIFESEMPGFNLYYKTNDHPYQLNCNISRFNFCLVTLRKMDKTIKNLQKNLLKIFEIPNIFLFGHTNLLSSKFCAYTKGSFNNAICNLKFQISSPVFDINLLNYSFYKSFCQNLKMFNSIFIDPNSIDNEKIQNKNLLNLKIIFFSIFKCMLPLINLEFSIKDPKFMVTDDNLINDYNKDIDDKVEKNMIIIKFSELIFQYNSKRFVKKNNFDPSSKEQIHYYIQNNFNLLNFKIQHRIFNMEKNTSTRTNILQLNNISLTQLINIKPNVLMKLDGNLNTIDIDLSELKTMVTLSRMIEKIDKELLNLDQIYFKDLYESFANKLQNNSKNNSINDSSLDKDISITDSKMILKDLIFDSLPSYFDYVKLSLNNITLTLGARSVFMPNEIFQNLSSQSPKDLVNGKLRKYHNKINSLQISLTGDYTQIYNKIDTEQPKMVKIDNSNDTQLSSTTSSINSLDNISSSESTKINHLWLLNILIDNIISSVIYEPTKISSSDQLEFKTISKIQVLSIRIFPDMDEFLTSDNNRNKIIVQIDNKKIDAVFCLVNAFLIISGIHTLNQIFGSINKSTKYEPWAKTYLKTLKANKKKKRAILSLIDWNEFKSMVEIRCCFDILSQIFSMPNGLKTKFETMQTFINIKNLSEISISGEYFRLLTESPTVPNSWARMLTICRYSIKVDKEMLKDQIANDFKNYEDILPSVIMENESWHFSIPYKFEMYQLFDNITTIVKSFKQMLYSFKTSNNNLVIFPTVVKTPSLPKIKLKSQKGILSFDDDPFEAQLSMIFQIGLEEQRSRLAKIAEFNLASTPKKKGNQEIQKCTKPVDVFNKLCCFSKMFKINHISNGFTKNGLHSNKRYGSAKRKSRMEKNTNNISNENKLRNDEDLDYISEENEKNFMILLENLSTSWIKRIQSYKHKEKEQFFTNFPYLWGNIDYSKIPDDLNKKVLDFITSPFLSTLIIDSINIDIFKPKCGIKNIPTFIHDVGKGVPKETEYSIMFPIHLDAKFSEIRWHLKDYPLPFIYIPPLTSTQYELNESIRIYGDFIVAEDMIKSDHEIRTVFVPLVPSIIVENQDNYYSLLVPRTITSVKIFTDLKFDIHSKATTTVTWCDSYSPAIQQTMQTVDHFSKPPLDPSKKTGFWDKIRYMFHARVKVSWLNQGKFNVNLKGSKSPYKLGGKDAGFILGFAGDVVLNCNMDNDPKKFLSCSADTVHFSIPNHFARPLLIWSKPSSEAIFIPNKDDTNLQHCASYYYFLEPETNKSLRADMAKMEKEFIEKTGIKLSGGMTLSIGFIFERTNSKGDRTFDFKPHYETRLSNPIYIEDISKHDSYAGFRSDFIHMSFTLLSNSDTAYNAMQLTPSGVQTFLEWWQSFSGNTNARRGPIWNTDTLAPKFGVSLTTMSYHADVSPFFISNIQSNVDTDSILKRNYLEVTEFAGVKAKVARFVMDLHQRKEAVTTYNKELDQRKTYLQLKFLEGDFSMFGIDVRCLMAKFNKVKYMEEIGEGKFDIFDNDMSWYDPTDFNEAYFINVENYVPHVYISPLLYSPQFLYQKRASYGDDFQRNPKTFEKIKPFRNDISHDCTLGSQLSSGKCLIRSRLATLQASEEEVREAIKKNKSSASKKLLKDTIEAVKNVNLLCDDMDTLSKQIASPESEYKYNYPIIKSLYKPKNVKDGFQNRFLLMNMLLKCNIMNRDILYKYLNYFSLRKDFYAFEMQKSLRIFDEMLEKIEGSFKDSSGPKFEQKKSKCDWAYESSSGNTTSTALLEIFKNGMTEILCGCSHAFYSDMIVELIAPQVQFMTDIKQDNCVIVAAPVIKLKAVSFDSRSERDVTNENVILTRYGLYMEGGNVFVFHKDEYRNFFRLFFDDNPYGHSKNQKWPPWLGLEICLEPTPLESEAMVKKLSIVFFFDKVPQVATILGSSKHLLRDRIRGFLPDVTITSDSRSYISAYDVFKKLIVYSDSENNELNKKIEKLKIGYDTSDFTQMHWTANQLSSNVKLLRMLQHELLFKQSLLDDAGKVDLVNMHNERLLQMLRLYMLMKIFSDRCKARDDLQHFTIWDIKVKKINLHMLNRDGSAFINAFVDKIGLERTSHASGANQNSLDIKDIAIYDAEKNVIYHEILQKYESKIDILRRRNNKPSIEKPLVSITWSLGKPVGGITFVQHAETFITGIDLHIEEERIRKIISWLYPDEMNSLNNDDDTTETIISNSKISKLDIIDEEPSVSTELNEELNEIIERSATYLIVNKMTLNGFKLCISYRGKGTMRLANVSNFIFKFPALHYSNQVLMLLEIFQHLKKTVIKAIVHQSGKLIGTKLTKSGSSHARLTSPLRILSKDPEKDSSTKPDPKAQAEVA
ncbi:hypothetical protein TBLA_0J00220 [Henningerozyma blattae CBS 6284]|uniref:Uncharacterized protein n=1 Tax=Henningerozyma blattae (strain ATCC 34711 / CBS 6284 / DSM 70876 / NBRC 10599 / NRRL Y-10934 / UCD 77-7) TaxID=1071380 RepID=I2H9H0_HENB6|nr:hypothetical protein TBLA_0J00220 [Tetrapisispora blattae CBS 6284]CCH63022.1 hypothetical protein TBLA_0J00220 [Tetrapisispora blattae CBS 6284]